MKTLTKVPESVREWVYLALVAIIVIAFVFNLVTPVELNSAVENAIKIVTALAMLMAASNVPSKKDIYSKEGKNGKAGN